jgi:hypothetical protein
MEVGVMYDANEGTWLVRETGVMFGPEISSYVLAVQRGFSMNKVMNGYVGWTRTSNGDRCNSYPQTE